MIIDLNGVDATPRKYIKEEGNYILKCTQVKEAGKTSNGNQIIKFFFQNKNEETYIEDVVLTPDTKFRIKQLADAFGFTYNNINIYNFVGLYLVAFLQKEKVKNKNGEIVEVLRCKQFSKSAKLVNKIPNEGTIPVSYEKDTYAPNNYNPSVEIDNIEIPF